MGDGPSDARYEMEQGGWTIDGKKPFENTRPKIVTMNMPGVKSAEYWQAHIRKYEWTDWTELPDIEAIQQDAFAAGQTQVIGWIQRHQPGGSPIPGDWKNLIDWIASELKAAGRKEGMTEAAGLKPDSIIADHSYWRGWEDGVDQYQRSIETARDEKK